MLDYAYDVSGNRKRIVYDDVNYFAYVYDDLNRPVQINRNGLYGVGTIGYDAEGRVESVSQPNVVSAWRYDAVSRLNHLEYYLPGWGTGMTQTFGYNPADQVTAAAWDNEAFAFNERINVPRGYAVNGLNQYTAAGLATFSYDANGNLIGDGTRSYGYDAENRLVSTSAGASLDYDPLGRLWRVTKNGVETQFQYDGDALVAEYDADIDHAWCQQIARIPRCFPSNRSELKSLLVNETDICGGRVSSMNIFSRHTAAAERGGVHCTPNGLRRRAMRTAISRRSAMTVTTGRGAGRSCLLTQHPVG